MIIIDAKGNSQDWNWVKEKYNLPEIGRALKELDHWEVIALHENCRDSSMTVRLTGERTVGIPIAFNWPGETLVQKTDDRGQTGFGMGPGAYYPPKEKAGPHWVYVADQDSDLVDGLGMIGKRDHWHLEPTFQFVKRGGPEPGECAGCKRKEKALSEIHAKAAEALG